MEADEREQKRAEYQRKADETGKEVWWRGERFSPGGVPQVIVSKRECEYKVVTQRDEFFESKFDPQRLEMLLNNYADEGWRVVSMTATDVGSFWGSLWPKGGGAARQELVVLLERRVQG